MSTSETPTSAATNVYDEIPYPSAAFPQTHPNRLAAMARLFGLAAADPMTARVLELGCADGSNLLPMADHAPGARFLGIDASGVQIASGQRALTAAGLGNVELRQQNILDFPASEGKFDYIIAHGVYSWVPDDVRDKILSICQEHLTDNGVAYISYNAHPGWNMRQSLRDMMLFHTRNLPDPKAKVQQARALLAFLAESVPTENNPYGTLLRQELAGMTERADNYLLHDILGRENTPFYFHEFVSRAASHGLQYLSEPSLAEMLTTNFSDKVRETLAKLNNQILAQEQYMDFLRNRTFRQTLLCRGGASIQRNITAAQLPEFSFRSLLVDAGQPIELVPGVMASFDSRMGARISSSDPFVKALLAQLVETKGIEALSYRELLESARSRSRPFMGEAPANRDEVDEATLQVNLVNLLAKGFVEPYAVSVRVCSEVPSKPLVGSVARYHALNANLITNRLHQPIPADLVARFVLAVCDGSHTREQIVDALLEHFGEGKLQLKEGTTPVSDPAKVRALLQDQVDRALIGIAHAGFFAR